MKRITQKKIFSNSEGEQWFKRNIILQNEAKKESDRIFIQLLKFIKLKPVKVLEIGCSNGNRLNLIKKKFHADCWGLDPSFKAIENGTKRYSEILLSVGTADNLPYEDNCFDTVIFGFCLYVCDRNDLFKIAYEANRCLKDEGVLIIEDFYPNFSYKNKYTHYEGIYSYKMNYPKMFLWNPSYTEIANVVFSSSGFEHRYLPNDKVSLTVLKKNNRYAYLEEPY